jgi:hypothetical protein
LNFGVSRNRFGDFLADPDSRNFNRFYTNIDRSRYVMAHSPGNNPLMWKRQLFQHITHGVKIVDLFDFESSISGKKTPLSHHLIVKMQSSFYQDRLGTTIGKALKKKSGCVGYTCDYVDPVGKTASFFEFSLCLSRACLGKMFVFI